MGYFDDTQFDDTHDMLDAIETVVQRHVQRMQEVLPEDLGLDRRAGYRLYVDRDFIVCSAGNDRSLQYYGGFEYVDKECRREAGDWVFYSRDDSRVEGHLEQFEAQSVE
jgi:hypothetical protein